MKDALTILEGDALDKLRELPSESVQCCVTSPPYWGLRDYGTAQWEGGDDECDHVAPAGVSGGQRADRTFTLGEIYKEACGKCGAKRVDSQLGLEKTPEEYVAKMVEVFREVKRVMRHDGTLWLNLGSSMAGSWGNYHPDSPPGKHGQRLKETARWNRPAYSGQEFLPPTANIKGFKPKDLVPIPWMVAMALQADGWWLRQDIIWSKPGPMPESVTDRFCKSHEYIFLLTKSAHYFFDQEAVKEPSSYGGYKDARAFDGKNGEETDEPHWDNRGTPSRIRRSVWRINTEPFSGAHFAVFPEEIPKLCIMAGTSAKGCCAKCGAPCSRITEAAFSAHDGETNSAYPQGTTANRLALLRQAARERGEEYNGQKKTLGWQPTCPHADAPVVPCTILDPFSGSGTSGAVALELGRKAILIELNPKYVALIEQRCDVTMGLALAV